MALLVYGLILAQKATLKISEFPGKIVQTETLPKIGRSLLFLYI